MAYVTNTDFRVERKCPLAGVLWERAHEQEPDAPVHCATPPVCEMYKVTGTDACTFCMMMIEDQAN
jgi:hypothetical protein